MTIDEFKVPLSDLPLFERVEVLAMEFYKLGLFLGTSTGSEPIFDLDQPLTRLQALVLTIRLQGLEEEALAFEGDNPFDDVPDWGAAYAAFAFAQGITNGTSPDTFSPNDLVTCQQFTAFLLRTLGYSEKDGDFEYDDTLKYAQLIELISAEQLADLGEGVFLRGNAVVEMVLALMTLVKDSDNVRLINTLIDAGVITQEEAVAFVEVLTALGGG